MNLSRMRNIFLAVLLSTSVVPTLGMNDFLKKCSSYAASTTAAQTIKNYWNSKSCRSTRFQLRVNINQVARYVASTSVVKGLDSRWNSPSCKAVRAQINMSLYQAERYCEQKAQYIKKKLTLDQEATTTRLKAMLAKDFTKEAMLVADMDAFYDFKYLNKSNQKIIVNEYIKNFNLDFNYGYTILCAILEDADPEIAKLCTSLVIQHLGKLNSYIIGLLLKKDIDAIDTFTNLALEQFETIEMYIIDSILEHNPKAAKLFTPLFLKHTDKLARYTPIISKLLEGDPDAQSQLTKIALEQFETIDVSIIYGLLQHNPQAAKLFTPLFLKHRDKLTWWILDLLLKHDPDAANPFTTTALEQFETIDPGILDAILTHKSDLIDCCFEKIDAKLLALIQAKNPLIQSVAHIRKNKRAIICTYKYETEMRENKKFIRIVLKKERELANQGYFTAYHAQSSDKFVPILFDTFLYGLRTQQNIENFLLLHTKKNPVFEALKQVSKEGVSCAEYCAQCLKIKEAVLEKQSTRREGLLNGRKEDKDRRKFLFFNDCLFGNIEISSSNSFPHYFYDNWNAGGSGAINNKIEEIFEYHGLQKYVSEFSQEINKLYEEYIEISKYGTLYLLGIPKKNIKKNVVFVATGGFQAQCAIKQHAEGVVETTTDMDEIAHALVTEEYVHQKDQKEYVGIMTYDKDGLLNPDSGLKAFPFIISTDEKRYQEWQAKWNDVTARLAQRIEQERSQIWGY
jgi:hypothetical protein